MDAGSRPEERALEPLVRRHRGIDPTKPSVSSMASAGSDDPFETCARCDSAFERGVWYPVTVVSDADGSCHLYSFCDATCEERWDAA